MSLALASILLTNGIRSSEFVQAAPLSAGIICECGTYIANRYGLDTSGMSSNTAKAFVEILGRDGFRRVSTPQVGALAVLQPSFWAKPENNQAGHIGVIVNVAEKEGNWWLTLRQASATNTGGKTEYGCRRIQDVRWAPFPKDWDNQNISYWLPPDTNGTAIDTSRALFLTNASSGKVLVGLENETRDGLGITQMDVTGDSSQQVKFEPANAGDGRNWYNIKFIHSGKYLAIDAASLDLKAGAVQSDNNLGDDARWLLLPRGNGYYSLQNRKSGQLLTNVNPSWVNKTTVVQLPGSDVVDQQWGLLGKLPLDHGEVYLMRDFNRMDYPQSNPFLGLFTLNGLLNDPGPG